MNANRIYRTLGVILLLAVTFWVFLDSRRNPFHFDDALFLQSPQVTEPGDPWFLLRPDQTRQITYLTFYWNYRLGAADPAGYHWVNLILHLSNVLAFYFFVRLLIRYKPRLFDPLLQSWLPFLAAGVFALHPVQTEPVNYVYQRSTLLAAFFMLLSMNSYLKSQDGDRRKGWLVSSGICFGLAVASKEAALVLPLLWVLLVWSETSDWGALWRSVLRSRGFLAVVLFASSATGWTLYNLNRSGERTVGLALMSDSAQYLTAQVQVLAKYLGLLLVPSGLSIDHDFHPAPLASFSAFLCLALLATIVLICMVARRAFPLPAMSILAFFILLIPTSSVVPSKDLLFEHRLYLPMIAAAIMLSWGILAPVRMIHKDGTHRMVSALVLMALLLGVYGVLSKKRTLIWGSAARIWQDAVDKAPFNPRAHYNLAVVSLNSDREKARQEFLTTLNLDSRYAAALYNLGWLAQGDLAYDSARKYYAAALQADPAIWQAHQGLGNLDTLSGDLKGAEREFRETIRLRPGYWPAYLSLAALLLRVGDTQASLAVLQNLMQFRWDLLEARYLKACGLIDQGRYAEADSELKFIAARDAGLAYGERIAELRKQFPAERQRSQ